MRLLISVLLLPTILATPCPHSGDGWHTVILDSTINYIVRHKIEGSTLHLQLEGATTGWLGFGFGEPTTGHMKGADMVTVYVSSDGHAYAEDRYATFAPNAGSNPSTGVQSLPALTAALDTYNDYTIISGSQLDGTTSVYVTRPLDTSDTQDRVVAANASTAVVWA